MDALVREALLICGVLCLPVLVAAAAVGIAVAVVQAATQIQEQTLTLLPKIVVVGAIVLLFGRFGIGLCMGLFQSAIREIPDLVRGVS